MDADELRIRASRQNGIASRRQLLDDGMTAGSADWAARSLRRPFAGVYLTGWAPLSTRQEWHAATLTTLDTGLAFASAAGFWEMRRDPGHFVTVVRPGNRGRSRYGRLVVAYSSTLAGNVVTVDGLRVTTPERTIIDLWPHLADRDRAKMLREALRRDVTTIERLALAIERHRRRQGIAGLRAELARMTGLPFHRCKSDGEAYGLAVLAAAGVEIPRVNVQIAGKEADFSWPALRDIVEIDGPQWHRFKEDDARKTAIWTAAGYRVRRIGTELLFAEPTELPRLTPPP